MKAVILLQDIDIDVFGTWKACRRHRSMFRPTKTPLFIDDLLFAVSSFYSAICAFAPGHEVGRVSGQPLSIRAGGNGSAPRAGHARTPATTTAYVAGASVLYGVPPAVVKLTSSPACQP